MPFSLDSLTRARRPRGLATVLLAAGLALAPAGLRAQSSSLTAERTVDYRTDKTIDLKAQVGPVRVNSVEFQNLGRGFNQGGGGFARFKPGTSASEVSTTIRAHFLAENPDSDEWEVTFIVEYLDKNNKVIERQTKKHSWEGEAKPFDFDVPLLEYVMPSVAQVKVKLEARKS